MIKQFWNKVRPTTRRAYIIYGVIGVVAIVSLQMLLRAGTPDEEVVVATPQVTVKSAGDFASGSSIEAVGTVNAVSEVTLKAEAGGQVTAVNTDLGKTVPAGFVIAQFENARERAALTQAQGSYDAAVAGAAQTNSGAKEAALARASAEAAYESAIKNSYVTLNGVTLNTIDTFFSDPNSFVPGLRVNGDAASLNADRIALRNELPVLQASLSSLSPDTTTDAKAKSVAIANRLLRMVDELALVVERDGDKDTLQGAPLSTYTTPLLTARTALTGVVSSLDAAERQVASAVENEQRANLAGTNSSNSLANAQIKIALGAVRAAQAAYERTLVRTPISGVVNALSIKRGDYVSPLQNVALVANNNGLEIDTAITEADRDYVAIGNTVTINGTATGTVTAIGGAVDPATGKIGVKVAIDSKGDLTNGTTVTVTFATKASNNATKELILPLRAVKLTADGAVVFSVKDDSTLEARAVVLGSVLGDTVVVESGIAASDRIISDARGRKAGEKVDVTN